MFRPKCLIVAPWIDGSDVGESRSNHRWIEGIAERADLTLLSAHRPGRPTAKEQFPDLRVIEWSDPSWSAINPRVNAMLKPGYPSFFMRARKWIREATKKGETFELGHQISPLAMRYPSPLVVSNTPYLIGPLGGSLDAPQGFSKDLADPWYVRLRGIDRARFRWDRLLRNTYKNASLVIGVAPYVRELLADIVPSESFCSLSETGLLELPALESSTHSAKTTKLLFVGRLIRSKGLFYALKAMERLSGQYDIHMDVAGQGPDENACRNLVQEAGLDRHVTFHGQVPIERVWEFYRDSDVFVFPSVREPSGNVVLEAMAHALPVVTTTIGGPGHVVDETCGIRCHASDPEVLVDSLTSALENLITNPDLRRELGQSGRKRIEETYLWPRKIDWLMHRYQEVLEKQELPFQKAKS